jgi:glycerol-3-phosphate acyltransferase PlsY
MGAWRAVLVATLDVLKGAIPVALAILFGASPLAVALTGVAAIVGAWASVFLRFHGGRGLATGIGATLVIQPLVIPLAAPFFFVTIWITKYVSLGSLIASAAGAVILAILVFLGWNDPAYLVFAVLGAVVVWIAHHDNIQRLMRGEERRFDMFARGGDKPAR